MYSTDLSKKIVQIEQEIREFKTSQFLGSGSGILIPVRSIDWTWSVSGGNYIGRVLIFDSKASFFPLITPYLTATLNGSPTTKIQTTYDFFGAAAGTVNFPSIYSPSNPKQSMCAIEFVDSYPYSSGTIRITGTVYANCYGTLRVFNNGNEET